MALVLPPTRYTPPMKTPSRHLALGVVLVVAAGCACSGDPTGTSDAATETDGARTDAGIETTDLDRDPVCTADGWCWESALPAGGPALAIAAVAPGQAVAVGEARFFHVGADGSIGHAPRSPEPGLAIAPIWGAAIDDVWSADREHLVHFDGTQWSADPEVPRPRAIHGLARDDVWATSQQGVFHFDGSGWTMVVANDRAPWFGDVWAIGPDEAIVASEPVLAVRADGTVVPLDGPSNVAAIYARSADDVWALAAGQLHHRQDGSWSRVDSTLSFTGDLWGTGDDLWIGGSAGQIARWDGATLTPVPIEGVAYAWLVSGTSASDLWVADRYDGSIHHYDGSAWTAAKSPLLAADLTDVAALDDGRAAALAASPLSPAPTVALRDAAGAWSLEALPPATAAFGVARAGDQLLLFANDGTYHRSGDSWERLETASMRDACTTSDGTTWLVGHTSIARRDAGSTAWVFLADAPPLAFTHVHCVGNEAWAVARGTSTPPVRLAGDAWVQEGPALIDPLAFALDDEGRVLAVGPRLSIWRRESPSEPFAQIADGVDLPSDAGDAHVAAADDIWAAAAGALWHFDGSTWRMAEPTGSAAIRGFGATQTGTLYAVGLASTILRLDP